MHAIDLRDFLKIIRKRIRLIIVITVLMPLITGIFSIYYCKPLYQTHTTLLIGRPQGYEGRLEYTDVLMNQKLTATYSEIAKSRYVSSELIKRLELKLTNDEVRDRIEVTSVKDTEIIRISVIDENPYMAALMADEVSKIFMEHVAKIMDIENIQFVDTAEIQLMQYKPRPVLNIAIAIVAGIMTSFLMVLMAEYLDNTVKTQEDIEKYFMLPVIGVIPKVSLKRGEAN